MRLLLDTQVFLWSVGDDRRLSPRASEAVGDAENDAYLSVVSAWEIAIKFAQSRLDIPDVPARYVPDRMRVFRFLGLAVEMRHALQVADLPAIHRDPFDRLLIAQAQVERLAIVTNDPQVARYDVEVIW